MSFCLYRACDDFKALNKIQKLKYFVSYVWKKSQKYTFFYREWKILFAAQPRSITRLPGCGCSARSSVAYQQFLHISPLNVQ